MPTIAEILAARKLAAAPAPAATVPGKPPSRSLVISARDAATDAPLNDLDQGFPPKWLTAEPRSLSATTGEALPMIPADADKETTTWHEAMNSFETELCVMRDPVEPEVVWLAVRATRAGLPPLLLHRLPWTLWEHPAHAGSPF